MDKYYEINIRRRNILLTGLAAPWLAVPRPVAVLMAVPGPAPGVVVRDGWILSQDDR